MNETRTYPDGTTATGPSPLPAQSPKQQDSETGPCDKCQGGGKLFDRRIGDVECDECGGTGWFFNGEASTWCLSQCTTKHPYCAKQIGPCLDGCQAIKVQCSDVPHGDCWRVKP